MHACFLISSEASLQQALDAEPSADISQVVESLLSIEAIREAEEMGTWDGDSSSEGEDEGPTRAEAIAAWKSLSQEEKDQAWVGGQKTEATPRTLLSQALWEADLGVMNN